MEGLPKARICAILFAGVQADPHSGGIARVRAQRRCARTRLEVRTLEASTTLNDYLDWPGLKQVFRLHRKVTFLKTGEVREERRR